MAQEEMKKPLFDSALPDIEDLKVIVTREGEGVSEWNRERYYSKEVGEMVNCSNPLCHEGGSHFRKFCGKWLEKEAHTR